MKLKGKDRQKIRSTLRKLGISIMAGGKLDPYCFLEIKNITEVSNLGAELYFDPMERCMKIKNWRNEK